MPNKNIKIILFDLNTEKLKQAEKYGEKAFTKAYADIRKFFKKNDFKHMQGSVYISKKPISDSETMTLLKILANEKPKIIGCVNKIDIGNVEDSHDATIVFSDCENTEASFDKSTQPTTSTPDKTDTMEYYEAEIAKQQKQQLPHGEDLAIEKLKQDKER
ncbi:MAG: hypothetical protein RR540_00095 [Oscillospiraceae bacterium]